MRDQNGREDQEIHEAAKSGNLSELKNLISKNRELIFANGWNGIKPLHYAARSGNLECVKYLVECGTNVNVTCNVNQTTPIFEASTKEIASYLHEQGASLNLISTKGSTPLEYAIRGRHLGVVKYLINSGVDVNFKKEPDFYTTLLQNALNNFITDDTNIDSHDSNQISLQILEVLLKAGSNPNQRNVFGRTALHDAIGKRLISIIPLLLKFNADPCIRDEAGKSCFEHTNDNEILKLLEPYKNNLKPFVKKQDDFKTLINRIIATGIVSKREFLPCSEKEINNFEKMQEVILPEEYKIFLRVMGNGAGSFLKSDHWTIFIADFDDYLGKCFLEVKNEDLEEGEKRFILPEKFFVFASRLGECNLGFFADGQSNDPIIYQIEEEGKIEKKHDSFWGFFQEMVEYYEFYSDPQKFGRNKKKNIGGKVNEKKWWKFWN